MKYELAKKLKDAGFSQFPLCIMESNILEFKGIASSELLESLEVHGEIKILADTYIPTFSDLIKACGKNFGHLDKEGESFVAFSVDGYGEDYNSSTPEEAVAHLWLRLNKKKSGKNLQERYVKIPKDFFDKLDFKIEFDKASAQDIKSMAMMESLKKKNQKSTNRENVIDALTDIIYACYGQGKEYLDFNVGRTLDKIFLEQKEEIKKEQFSCIMLKNIDWDDRKIIKDFLNEFYGEK